MKPQNRKKRRRIRSVVFAKAPKLIDGRPVIDIAAQREERQRAAFDETKTIRMLKHQVDEQFAKSQECGHSIGRLAKQLKWPNELAARRIGAGFRFAEIVTEYNKWIIGAPNPNPKAMDISRVNGRSTTEIGQDSIKSLTNDYMRLIGALEMAANGRASKMHLFRVLSLACIEDAAMENWHDGQINDLVRGLDAVSGI